MVEVRFAPHVAPVGRLADVAVEVAGRALEAIRREDQKLGRILAEERRRRRTLAPSDHRFVAESIHSLFRWLGWVEAASGGNLEAMLTLAVLLDARAVHPVVRVWGRAAGFDPGALVALGDAPDWTAKTDGFKRLAGGRPVTVDPWRLFPPWFREVVPLPPGDGPPKSRQVALIRALQSPPPLWVRATGAEPERLWNELRELGLRPWVHRRLPHAARLESDVDVIHLPPFLRGDLEIQDLAGQAVALACDPEPGERWWDTFAGTGGHALQLASRMGGKGSVIATDTRAALLKPLALRARRGPFRNLTTKAWDGKHVAGKAGTFAGVLVDPPSSGLGLWRRHPDARWSPGAREGLERHAATQAQYLGAAAAGVRAGGVLVYAVPTFPPAETSRVVEAFLAENPAFGLDPFPDPLTAAETDGMLRLWPHEGDHDGVFMARMIRKP